MELIVKEINIPEKIEFNYTELKQEIDEKLDIYRNLVYQEKDLKVAKSDKAALNRLKKALNDERIRREKEYMKPFVEFKNQINEIIDIIDEPVRLIDSQIKEYESEKKEKKKQTILKYFNDINKFDWLDITKIYNMKWLNTSFSMKKVQEEITLTIERIENDIETIKSLQYKFEVEEYYKKSLDLNYAIAEVNKIKEIQHKKYLQEELKKRERQMQQDLEQNKINYNNNQIEINKFIENPVQKRSESSDNNDNNKQWLSFTALLDVEHALKLKQFFIDNNIAFKPL
jgi:hypothetical protein